MKQKVAVVLLSGGLDSTVALTRTLKTWDPETPQRIAALTVNYGQTHAKETRAAQKIALLASCNYQIIDARQYQELAWESALTMQQERLYAAGPSGKDFEGIPLSYVPMRNTMLLTMAAALVESSCLSLLARKQVGLSEIQPQIVIGANVEDFQGYPDCRPDYYRSLMETFYLGSKLGAEYRVQIEVVTPLITMTKPQIIRMGMEEEAPLHLTWSCYKDGAVPCGQCDACRLRAKGFADAGVADPALAKS